MIPLKLQLEGFLSYREPVEIDFTPITLACISGPNGAGKSSLLDAITWALFGQARRRDDALINTASDVAQVALEFEYEGHRYRVRRVKPRGKSTLLEFAILQENGSWKSLAERKMRLTQARIEQELRINYDTFVNASYFLQNRADNFARLRPAERKEVLAQILGLTEWDAYREAARARRREVEEELQHLEGRLAEVAAEIAHEDEYRREQADLERQLTQATAQREAQEKALQAAQQQQAALEAQRRLVAQLRQQWETHQATLNRLQERLNTRQAERERWAHLLERAQEIREQHRRWREVRAQLDEWEARAAQYATKRQALEGHRRTIAQARARLEQERETLLARQAEIQALEEQRRAWQAKAEALDARHKEILAQLARREELEAQRQALQERLAHLQAELARIEGEGKEHRQRKEQLENLAPEASHCPLCGQLLTPNHREQVLAELDAALEGLRQRFVALKAEQKEHLQEARQVDQALQDLGQVEAQERTLAAQHERLQAQIAQAEATVAQWAAQGAPRLREVERLLEQEAYAQEAHQALQALEEELRALGYDAQTHEQLRQEEQRLRQAGEELRQLEQAQARLETLERELGDLQRDLTRQQEQTAQAQAAYQEAAQRLTEAEASLPDLHALEDALTRQQIEENRLREAVAAARQRVATIERLKETRRTLEAQRSELARRIEEYKLLEQAFGRDGVPALLIEQILPHIEEEANALLDRLTDGALQVHFVTQRPYKDKRREDLKETLDIQISDRYGVRDYEMYSGGEAFRVNFAIRVALAKVLARRAGARLQTLVIDEGFGSQDAQGRQRLLEAIHTIRSDFAKILVITHIEELKEAFPYRIEVEKTPHGSRVRVVAQ